MDVGAVCHPAGQLFSSEASHLQLIGIRSLGLPFGGEVDERGSRVHVELRVGANKVTFSSSVPFRLTLLPSTAKLVQIQGCQTANETYTVWWYLINKPISIQYCLFHWVIGTFFLVWSSMIFCFNVRGRLITIWKTSDPSSKSTDAKKTLLVKALEYRQELARIWYSSSACLHKTNKQTNNLYN